MSVETQPKIPQVEMSTPTDQPIQRVIIVTLPEGTDNQILTLKIDGRQLSVPKKKVYTISDALSVIKLACNFKHLSLINTPIKEIITNDAKNAINAKKIIGRWGRVTYSLNEEGFVNLVKALLLKIDPYRSSGENFLILPDGQQIPNSNSILQNTLLGLMLAAKKEEKTVKETELFKKCAPDLSELTAISRVRNLMQNVRMRLKPYGWMIKNYTSRPDLVQGQESEYELMPIANHRQKNSVPTKERQEETLNHSPKTDVASATSTKTPLTERGRKMQEEAIARVKGNLELECTSIILKHFKLMKNLQQVEVNLFNFLRNNLTNRPPYNFSLQDIIQVSKPEYFKTTLKKFFIDFLRKRLKDASIMSRQKEFTSSLEKEIKETYDSIALESKEHKIEDLIQIACEHFRIEYEEPSKPATSSPAI